MWWSKRAKQASKDYRRYAAVDAMGEIILEYVYAADEQDAANKLARRLSKPGLEDRLLFWTIDGRRVEEVQEQEGRRQG